MYHYNITVIFEGSLFTTFPPATGRSRERCASTSTYSLTTKVEPRPGKGEPYFHKYFNSRPVKIQLLEYQYLRAYLVDQTSSIPPAKPQKASSCTYSFNQFYQRKMCWEVTCRSSNQQSKCFSGAKCRQQSHLIRGSKWKQWREGTPTNLPAKRQAHARNQ